MTCEPEKNQIFMVIECFTLIVFLIEYLLRVLTCLAVTPRVARILPTYCDEHHKKEDSQPSYNGNMIDILCIFPFYVKSTFG